MKIKKAIDLIQKIKLDRIRTFAFEDYNEIEFGGYGRILPFGEKKIVKILTSDFCADTELSRLYAIDEILGAAEEGNWALPITDVIKCRYTDSEDIYYGLVKRRLNKTLNYSESKPIYKYLNCKWDLCSCQFMKDKHGRKYKVDCGTHLCVELDSGNVTIEEAQENIKRRIRKLDQIRRKGYVTVRDRFGKPH